MSIVYAGAAGVSLSRDALLASAANATIMAWLFPTSAPASGQYANAFALENTLESSGVGVSLFNNAGTTKWDLGTTTSDSVGTTVSLNTWRHLTLTKSAAATQTLYLDGVSDATNGTSEAAGTRVVIGNFVIATGGGAQLSWIGRIAYVKIWDAVLTATEILQEMRQGLPVRMANLKAFYPMYSTNDRTDYSGQAQALTTNGAAPTSADGPPIPWRQSKSRLIYVPAAGGGGTTTLVAGVGSYALSGQTVRIAASRRIAVANGSYALTGQDVGLHRALVMPAAAGAYTLTGQSVALRASRRIAVANGTYALNGQTVRLAAARRTAIANGSYALAGQAVRLAAARRLALSNGVYSLTGEAVTLTKIGATTGSTTLIAGLGSYVLTGEPVTLRALRRMAVAAGIYTLTGIDVRLGVAHLDDVGTILPSRGIVERRFGAIRTRNRPGSVLIDQPATSGQDVVGDSWTPDDSSGAGLSLSVIAEACRLVRASGLVYAFFAIVLPATVSTAPAAISLPIIARDTFVPVAPVAWSYITIADVTGIVVNGATQFNLYHTDGTPVTNADLSGAVLRGCAIYEAAS